MIFGSVSFTSDFDPVADKIAAAAPGSGLSLQHVSCPGLNGGFYINERLPYTPEDILYTDEANDVTVLFSGAVYNHSVLCEMEGIRTSVSCPWLVAELFTKYGPGFVSRLNGDFAMCIILPRSRRAFIFRDHVGIRPVAYTVDKRSLNFSTDIKLLSKAASGGREIDTTYFTGHFRYIDYRLTPCAKVRKLLPGHYLEYSESGHRSVRYWEPGKARTDSRMTHAQMYEELGSLVRDAVRIRCDSRFTAAAHVSGGLDSGIVSVLARREYGQQQEFFGFSWSPSSFDAEDGMHDERDLVVKTCLPAGITPVLSQMDRNSFPGVVAAYYDNSGYFSEYHTASVAAARGVNLVFSGWGGDEFISTGAPAIEADLLRSMHWRLYLQRNNIRRPKLFLFNFVRYVLYPALGILDRSTAGSFRDDARYLKKEFKKSDRNAIRRFYFNNSRHSHHLGMLEFYHLQGRCENWHNMGFGMGIEYRYPLLDRRIIEYMLRVPSVLLCQTGQSRPVLRELGKGILEDDVRLGSSKSDPVYWAYMKELYREASCSFMDELPRWKDNPDLGFIDFDLLEGDVSGYRSGLPGISDDVLFRALVYLKALHEFTNRYRRENG